MLINQIRTIIPLALFVLFALFLPVRSAATVVRLDTAFGVADIELYDTSAPQTVANFLSYVNAGVYNNTFIHRSVPGFIVQGGGFAMTANGPKPVVKNAPVINEFSRERSNVRGTIAMAKLPSDPHSATSQWFVNLADNATNLDGQNGGFTVFGRVMGNGMDVFDTIARLKTLQDVDKKYIGSTFAELPLVNVPSNGKLQAENLVMINSAAVLPTFTAFSEADRLFNYLEATFPEYLYPASQQSATGYGYYFRYYPGSGAYVATMDNVLYYLGPATDWNVLSLGVQADWEDKALAAGY